MAGAFKLEWWSGQLGRHKRGGVGRARRVGRGGVQGGEGSRVSLGAIHAQGDGTQTETRGDEWSGGPKMGGGTGRDLAKITQQAAPCRCGRTYGMPNSSAGGKAMRRKERQGKWLQGRLHSQGGRQGRDEWKAARPA